MRTGADYCKPMEERNHRILYALAYWGRTQESLAAEEGVTRQRIGALKRQAIERGQWPPPKHPPPKERTKE